MAVESSKISIVTPVAAAVSPAPAEGVLSFATLLLHGRANNVSSYLAASFETRDGELRC